MHTTPSPRRPALGGLAGCGLLLSAALVAPVALAAPQVPARTSEPALTAVSAPQAALTSLPATTTTDSLPSTTLLDQVTDAAGILTASTAEKAVATAERNGVHLWVVTYDNASELATDFAAEAWSWTGLGAYDVLLVINISTADPSQRSYAFDGDSRARCGPRPAWVRSACASRST